jgi:hypothetical protein
MGIPGGDGDRRREREKNMNLRRLVLIIGAVLLIAGAVALVVPVSVTGNDRSVSCGNAIASDMSEAQQADNSTGASIPVLNQVLPHSNFVAQCQSSLSSRRAWSIPLAVIGAVVIAGSFALGTRAGRTSATDLSPR